MDVLNFLAYNYRRIQQSIQNIFMIKKGVGSNPARIKAFSP